MQFTGAWNYLAHMLKVIHNDRSRVRKEFSSRADNKNVRNSFGFLCGTEHGSLAGISRAHFTSSVHWHWSGEVLVPPVLYL